jgi:hypothetical protein
LRFAKSALKEKSVELHRAAAHMIVCLSAEAEYERHKAKKLQGMLRPIVEIIKKDPDPVVQLMGAQATLSLFDDDTDLCCLSEKIICPAGRIDKNVREVILDSCSKNGVLRQSWEEVVEDLQGMLVRRRPKGLSPELRLAQQVTIIRAITRLDKWGRLGNKELEGYRERAIVPVLKYLAKNPDPVLIWGTVAALVPTILRYDEHEQNLFVLHLIALQRTLRLAAIMICEAVEPALKMYPSNLDIMLTSGTLSPYSPLSLRFGAAVLLAEVGQHDPESCQKALEKAGELEAHPDPIVKECGIWVRQRLDHERSPPNA